MCIQMKEEYRFEASFEEAEDSLIQAVHHWRKGCEKLRLTVDEMIQISWEGVDCDINQAPRNCPKVVPCENPIAETHSGYVQYTLPRALAWNGRNTVQDQRQMDPSLHSGFVGPLLGDNHERNGSTNAVFR